MIRIAVIDDVISICAQIEDYFTNIADKYGIEIEVEPYTSGESFCSALTNGEAFDLIFLDIELEIMNGIEVCRHIRHVIGDELQQIVFISAKKQYSLELHSFHPLDFMIKEITEDDLEVVFKRFLKIIGFLNDTFEYKIGRDIIKIKLKNIKYLMIIDRLVYIVDNDNQFIEYYGTLEAAYNEQLKKAEFLFVHRQYIVNPAYIHNYAYDKVILHDGKTIPIGSSRRKEIRFLQTKNANKRRK